MVFSASSSPSPPPAPTLEPYHTRAFWGWFYTGGAQSARGLFLWNG